VDEAGRGTRDRVDVRRAGAREPALRNRQGSLGVVIPLPRRPSRLEQLPPPAQDHPTRTWTQPVGAGRLLARFFLGSATGGAAVGLGLVAHQPTSAALAVVTGSAVVAVLTRNALSSSTPTTVTLAGPVLHVRRGAEDTYFDLANHRTRLRLVGDPGRASWRLWLENPGGATVELHRNQVDARVVHAVVLQHCDGRRGL